MSKKKQVASADVVAQIGPYRVTFQGDAGGWHGSSQDIPVFAGGKTLAEAQETMRQAILFHLRGVIEEIEAVKP